MEENKVEQVEQNFQKPGVLDGLAAKYAKVTQPETPKTEEVDKTPFDDEKPKDNTEQAPVDDKPKDEVKGDEKPKDEQSEGKKRGRPTNRSKDIEAFKSEISEEAPVETPEQKVKTDIALAEKAKQYDEALKDPLIEAVLNWRKSGGTNPKELIQSLGIQTQNKSIEDYFKEEASALGFEGDELAEAVEERLGEYESKSKIERRKILNEYQNKDNQITDEKIKSFSGKVSETVTKVAALQESATEKLQSEVKNLVGKKFKGTLLIDEPMANDLTQMAARFSTPITDETGNIVGYDVETGVLAATLVKHHKKMLSEAYALGKAEAEDEFASSRHRPNPEGAGTGASAIPNSDDAFKSAYDKLNPFNRGRGK